MARRCSHCGHHGHNSRTCPDRGVRLFGVRLTDPHAMRKSASAGNLAHYTGGPPPPPPPPPPSAPAAPPAHHPPPVVTPEHSADNGHAQDGYGSDGAVQTSASSRDRKKGVPWTEEEHRMFLIGLHKLGKGDWRGISRNFVQSRTPTQVASHAQKFFIRQSNLNKRKRRSSLFDIGTDTATMGRSFSTPNLSDIGELKGGSSPTDHPYGSGSGSSAFSPRQYYDLTRAHLYPQSMPMPPGATAPSSTPPHMTVSGQTHLRGQLGGPGLHGGDGQAQAAASAAAAAGAAAAQAFMQGLRHGYGTGGYEHAYAQDQTTELRSTAFGRADVTKPIAVSAVPPRATEAMAGQALYPFPSMPWSGYGNLGLGLSLGSGGEAQSVQVQWQQGGPAAQQWGALLPQPLAPPLSSTLVRPTPSIPAAPARGAGPARAFGLTHSPAGGVKDVGESQLDTKLGLSPPVGTTGDSSTLSFNLLEQPSRHSSAFQANPSTAAANAAPAPAPSAAPAGATSAISVV
eukprot:SM000026S08864  [mRNA]  locus=s26:163508:165672:- [translate_table: standard]